MEKIGFDLYGSDSKLPISRPIDQIDLSSIQQVEVVEFIKKFYWRLQQNKDKLKINEQELAYL